MDCPDTLDNILRFMMIEAKCSHEIHDLRSLTFEHLILVDGKRWYCLASNHSFLRSECVDVSWFSGNWNLWRLVLAS